MKKTTAFTVLLLACIFHIISAVPACADPLVITPGLGAGALVDNLMGTGVTYSNAGYTGAVNANGTFTGGTGVIGFESGIILSSGLATSAAGPNTSPGTSTIFSTAGDPDLNALGSTTTHDAAVLEFDFVPTADTLSFSFVFASEEYNEYVNSYNDIFAIFLDGANVAMIPGTSTPISINNINNCVNPAYYINNNSSGGSLSCNPTAVNANLNTQFDGLTVVITLNLPITSGTNHHLKIAIADVLDESFDSAVFIKSASFNSGTPTVTPTYTPTFTITPTFTWTLTQPPSFTPTFTPTITNTWTVTCTITPTVTMTATPPFCMELKGAFPNPFFYDTRIVYSLCRDSAIKLTVYTVSGEVVRVFEQDGFIGYNTIYWNARNRALKPVASGTYIYSLEAVSADDKKKLWGKVSAVR